MGRSSGASNPIEIACIYITETEKAICVDAGTGKVWVPKSMCEFEDGTLTLSESMAKDKGLI